MSSQTRQRLTPFHVDCRVTFGIAFRIPSPNVESYSTALSAVPVRMSSHTLPRIPLFQVECRVTPDSALYCSKSSVESHSTALSDVPGRMWSHTRQRFPPFQVDRSIRQRISTFRVECRVSLDSAFRCCRSNAESLDSVFRPSRPKVESYSIALSAVPD